MKSFRFLLSVAGFCLLVTGTDAEKLFVFGHGAASNKHPIQMQFDACMRKWDGSRLSDWDLCIVSAEKSWAGELNRVYQVLVQTLPTKPKTLLVASQQTWLKHHLADYEFAFGSLSFEYATGQEGLRMARQYYMEKKAARVLELTDYLQIWKESPKENRP